MQPLTQTTPAPSGEAPPATPCEVCGVLISSRAQGYLHWAIHTAPIGNPLRRVPYLAWPELAKVMNNFAATRTPGPVPPVTLQDLHHAGLNPFAVQLLVESFKTVKTAGPVTFAFGGVRVVLERQVG